jgi:cell shape-determining protein MreC
MISLTKLLGAVEQMLSALIVNQANVIHRGNIADFIASGNELVSSAKSLNQEQEQLKSALKLKTEQLNAVQQKLEDWQAEAVSSVKLSYRDEKSKWSEFGITAKK